jgi:hypothetical protein
MSRDKQWVLSALPSVPVKLMMYPTGAGTARRIDNGEFTGVVGASFLGDGNRVFACGNEPNHAVRRYVRGLAGGTFKPITPEGVSLAIAAPDGESIVAMTSDGYRRFSTENGASQSLPGLTPNDQILRYSPDGRFLWTTGRQKTQPVHVDQVDVKTGVRSTLIPDFSPPRPGVLMVSGMTLADDPHTYAYIEQEAASYLFELKRARK